MLKRTLFFSLRGHLRVEHRQLVYETYKENEKQTHRFPIEDLGFIVIESTAVTVTSHCLQALAANNTVVSLCDPTHTPNAILLPVQAHTLTQKHTAAQAAATDALKERLWKQTVRAKIENQARCLEAGGKPGADRLRRHIPLVKNGDPGNCEALAAKEYFYCHSGGAFRREREGQMPNPALNYGYAILRAAVARALVGSGLSCVIGIHHCNQYNAFALADDVMEPYRPFVDDIVLNQPDQFPADAPELTRDMKAQLLQVLTLDALIQPSTRPLFNAMSHTTASLVRCFLKEQKEITFPLLPVPCLPKSL